MLRTKSSKLSLLLLAAAAASPLTAGPLRIGSLATSRTQQAWTLDGTAMVDARAKLTNAVHFAAGSGIDGRPLGITDTAATIDAGVLANLDVFFVGYVADGSGGALTNAELNAIQTWVTGGGTLVAACDHPSYDDTCAFFGYGVTAGATNPMVPAVANDLFSRPFGKVTSFNGAGSIAYFATTAGATVLAKDSADRAVILEKGIGTGRAYLLGDVNFLSSVSAGPLVTNDNDRLLLNLFAKAAAPIRVGSIANTRFGSGWTFDASQMVNDRAKLLAAANFGLGGTVSRPIAITDTAATLTPALLAPFDVFFIGYLDDASPNAFTPAELANLQSWVTNGGTLVTTCDGTSYDAVCSFFGYAPNTAAANPMAPVVAHPIFSVPFGAVTTVNGAGTITSFGNPAGAVVLVNDSVSRPTMLYKTFGLGRVFYMGDVDLIVNGGITAGATITSSTDRLLGNLFAFGGGCCKAGDANGDGTVDVFDLVLLASYIVGNQSADTPPFVARPGTMNLNPSTGATTIDVFDLVLLASYIVGNTPALPL